MDESKAEGSEVEETEMAPDEVVELDTTEESTPVPEAPESQDVKAAAPEDSETVVTQDEAPEPAAEKSGVSIFKKILLWAAIVVAGLFFLLGLGSVIGVWAINTPLTDTVLAILQPIDNTLQRLETVSGEVATALSEASTTLGGADQRVQELGAGLAETNLVREALNQILDVDLEQKVGNARQGFRSIYDTVVAVEETINAINAIPLLSLEVPGSEEMANIRTGMEEVAAGAEELRQENQRRREERAENLVTAITTPINRLNDRVDEMQTRMTNSEARFGEAVENMDVLQSKVPRWIDIASIIATLLLAWLMFSQAAVIVLCWQWLHPRA